MLPTVLLIEDEKAVAAATAKLLSRGGVAVTQATTVAEALDEIRRGPVDLIVLDLHLGGSSTSGAKFLAAFRRVGSELPLVVYTGSSDVTSAQLGGIPVVYKPEIFELIVVVRRLLGLPSLSMPKVTPPSSGGSGA